MNAHIALARIAATLSADEAIVVTVTAARRRTLGLDYRVTREGFSCIGQRWGRQDAPVYGTLRREYVTRVLGR